MFTYNRDNFNNKYKVSIEIKEEKKEEEIFNIKEEVEDNRENYITRFYYIKKTSERYM